MVLGLHRQACKTIGLLQQPDGEAARLKEARGQAKPTKHEDGTEA